MKTSQQTVLVTGGSAGIGFEIARLFSEKGNKVIITGRDETRLQKAVAKLKNTTAIQSDVSKEEDVNKLVDRVKKDFPELSIVVNNAGQAYAYHLAAEAGAFEKAQNEMLTNYLSIIRLNEKLLPLLDLQSQAAIVNVTSIVTIAPSPFISTYSASKAALHSYTQSLRLTLAKNSSIEVFELLPPLVNTDFSQDIGGANGIPPVQVAEELLRGLENKEYEIRVGQTKDLYDLYLSSPADALLAMNSVQ